MDWLSRLLELTPVSGRIDIRCLFGAPWRIDHVQASPGEIPYHVVLEGTAVLEQGDEPPHRLEAGDILLFPKGAAHSLHDGSGAGAGPVRKRPGANMLIKENEGGGARLDMLCGTFAMAAAHERLLRDALPPRLVVRTDSGGTTPAARQLSGLLALMRGEAADECLGGQAFLNGLSAALFALVLRACSEADTPPHGLLALAAQSRLSPALAAMFREPAHPWTLTALAQLCNMSRATFARHFQDNMGRSASDLLTDIRMALAVSHLQRLSLSTGAVAEAVGYQSEAAFQRAFKQHLGVTPARWRAQGRGADPIDLPPLSRGV